MYNKRQYDGLTTEEKLDVALELLDQVLFAFPDGALAHRQAHIAWLQAKEAETKFWQELKLDIAKKGLWGLLVIMLGLLVAGVSVKSGVWFR
jgi:hypothetical protein